jgi:hypothetical protein
MATLETIEMFGKKGRLVVNKRDQKEWEKKGYSTEKPKEEKPETQEKKGK